jgi:outer membrane protein assembly factor BamB
VMVDRVYVGLDSGKVAAYRLADGGVLWEARVALPEGTTELQRMVDIDMRPLIFSDLLFAISYQGGLMAIDLETGRSTWFQEASSRQNLAYFGGLIMATMLDGKVVAYSATTGSQIWESSALLNRGITAPAATDLFIAVGETEDGYIHFLNRRNGDVIGRVKVDSSGISAAPLIVDQRLYVLDRGGDLHAYSIEQL